MSKCVLKNNQRLLLIICRNASGNVLYPTWDAAPMTPLAVEPEGEKAGSESCREPTWKRALPATNLLCLEPKFHREHFTTQRHNTMNIYSIPSFLSEPPPLRDQYVYPVCSGFSRESWSSVLSSSSLIWRSSVLVSWITPGCFFKEPHGTDGWARRQQICRLTTVWVWRQILHFCRFFPLQAVVCQTGSRRFLIKTFEKTNIYWLKLGFLRNNTWI